jgi:two-component system sensor histidine kinase VanS
MYALASSAAVRQVTNIMNSILPLAFAASLLISAGIAFVYSRRLAKPIVAISKVSRKMSSVDLSSRCDVERTDEIGDLARDLNSMAEKLQADFERERRQEKQRRDLFTAISHELKTPITILKGEIGGMIDNIGVYKDRDTYLQNAFKTTEQMEYLVREILTVSRLETKEIRLALGELDMSVAVNDFCQKYEDLASSQNVALVCYCEDGLFAKADKLQIQSAISNIISNAIFHSPQGEMVNVQLVKSDGAGVLTVENTGHINEADLENLFEPFYRGEKSRNRYTGGSGLGLYIVKRILEMHGFSFNIACVDGKVVFTVKFPLDKE